MLAFAEPRSLPDWITEVYTGGPHSPVRMVLCNRTTHQCVEAVGAHEAAVRAQLYAAIFGPVPVSRSVGVFARERDGAFDFLGTAFAFRDGSHFLTASHCVPDNLPTEVPPDSGVEVSLPSGVEGMAYVARVRSFVRHPTADLAVLTVEGDPPGVLESAADPFLSVGFVGKEVGEEFLSFGYPMSREPVPTFPGIGPTGRVFVGHYQRAFPYRECGREYEAAELSVPAPEGLSGAPVFNRERPSEVQAVVAGNREERIEQVREETISTAGDKHTLETYRIVSYGIAVLLDPLRGWLDEHVPVPS